MSAGADSLCSKLKTWLWRISCVKTNPDFFDLHTLWRCDYKRCRPALEADPSWYMRLWSRCLLKYYPGPFNHRLCWWPPATRSWYCTIAFMFGFLFLLQRCLSKSPAPMLGKWLDGFILKQAPELLFMDRLSTKCWDKLVDTGVSVLEINCNTDAVAEWELCTLFCPINCCPYIFWVSILLSSKICCNRHQLLSLLLECAV